jgi:predicted RNase H-like HicB family nuclease
MGERRYIIQAAIYPGDEGGYVAECLDLAVVTQGKTLDETAQTGGRTASLFLHRGIDSFIVQRR